MISTWDQVDPIFPVRCSKDGWPRRGVAQKNVGCLMELYEDVLQNSLHSIPVFFSGTLVLFLVQLLL
jgi:hypothetical protein